MQRITHTHMHMYSYTKRNCSVYTAQTEVLTKITNKWRAQKWIFSIKKTKHHTRNITTIQQQYLQLSFVPGNSIISRFICSSCRDPAGTGNALPRELHEFWEQESLNSNISTCLADPIWPHISWKCHPSAAHHAWNNGCSHPTLMQEHHPTFSFLIHLWAPWIEAPRTVTTVSNHDLWG